MAILTKIEQLTKAYADAHDTLTERVDTLQAELEAVRRQHMAGIRSAVRSAKTSKDKLSAIIEANPQEFKKPRTQIISGIRVGFKKGKGKLIISNEEKSIARVRKHMQDEADILIKTTETLIKKALDNLSVIQLRLLGITVEDASDQVVIKPTDRSEERRVGKECRSRWSPYH